MQRWLLILSGPILFGAFTGWALGVAAGFYLACTGIATVGGLLGGLEHVDRAESALRGGFGGLLFGTSVLLAHAVHGEATKADVVDPLAILLVFSTTSGVVLGVLGTVARNRYEARLCVVPSGD